MNELKGASAFFQRPEPEVKQASKPQVAQEPKTKTERPNASTERQKRTVQPTATIETKPTLLEEIDKGPFLPKKRETTRFSFEIFEDQKESIEELQYLFKKKTGKKLSTSRIIRESLDEFLTTTLEKLKED